MLINFVLVLSPVQLFANPSTKARQAPLSMEFSRQEYWSGLPFSPPGDLPDPRIEPASLVFPALAVGFFTTRAIWEDSLRPRPWGQLWLLLSCVGSGSEPSKAFVCSSQYLRKDPCPPFLKIFTKRKNKKNLNH